MQHTVLLKYQKDTCKSTDDYSDSTADIDNLCINEVVDKSVKETLPKLYLKKWNHPRYQYIKKCIQLIQKSIKITSHPVIQHLQK